MPAWRDIDPIEIGRNLRYVWAWKYDRAGDDFTGRLAGEEIDRAFGKSLRGVKMTSFYPPEGVAQWVPRLRRVALEPALMRGRGMVFSHLERTVIGERVVMPLAEDGSLGDGILGATVYHQPGPDAGRPTDPSLVPEEVAFFALEPEGVSATSG
jgi:hypothetical protein